METVNTDRFLVLLLLVFVVLYTIDLSLIDAKHTKELNTLEIKKEVECTHKILDSQESMLIAFNVGSKSKE